VGIVVTSIVVFASCALAVEARAQIIRLVVRPIARRRAMSRAISAVTVQQVVSRSVADIVMAVDERAIRLRQVENTLRAAAMEYARDKTNTVRLAIAAHAFYGAMSDGERSALQEHIGGGGGAAR